MTIREYIDSNGLEAEYDTDCAVPYMGAVAEALEIDPDEPLAHQVATAVAIAVHQGRDAGREIREIRELAESKEWADYNEFAAEVFARYGITYPARPKKYIVRIAYTQAAGGRRETRGPFDTEAVAAMTAWADNRYPDDPNEVEGNSIDFGDGVVFVEEYTEED